MKDPITFKVGKNKYYWEGDILMIEEEKEWKIFTGIIEYPNSKQWYENGKRHRTDGPADIRSGEEIWYYGGKRHRLNGPAVIRGNFKEYWINGMRFDKDDWIKMARKIKLEKLLS